MYIYSALTSRAAKAAQIRDGGPEIAATTAPSLPAPGARTTPSSCARMLWRRTCSNSTFEIQNKYIHLRGNQ